MNASEVKIAAQEMREVSELVLKLAKKYGASDAELSLNRGAGLSVEVHKNQVDKLEYNRDQGLNLTVYMGKNGINQGSATTGDLSSQAIEDTVKAACNIAKYTGEDKYTGLADADMMLLDSDNKDDLDLYHPWDLTAEQAIEITRECEAAALGFDKRIINSDGASISTYSGIGLIANTNGFTGILPSSRHSLSCSVIGQKDGDETATNDMQRDYWYSSTRVRAELQSPESVGKKSAERTLARLGGEKISTRKANVLYSPEMSRSIIGHFTSAISGDSQYRKSTYLLDCIDEKVFPDFIHLHEQPHIKQAFGSSYFDKEGVATRNRDIVVDGVVQNYIMSSYSARQLGLKSTANSGGTHNLTLDSTGQSFEELLKMLGTGFYVTELIGSGINGITGDYSRGAAGFWVENGEIQFPVEEVTVAGNLKDMLQNIVAVGTDVDLRGGTRTGSILVEGMMVAGA